MKTILLATHNRHKFEEFKAMLGDRFEMISLDDINLQDEIPETGDTFRENARQKASYVWEKTGGKYDVLADDSGLEVKSLNGEPGVWSARYAGEGCTSQDNIDKLLGKMKGMKERGARFVTVLALMTKEGTKYFEGEVRGKIIEEMHGKGGFGYDPIFVPEGESQSFGELPAERKNQMSHRANAIKELIKS
ncbi:MAG: RdgB/HAM1 family non-canonical purine NTP pyrophosphatase [Paludibacteraceae bacterium]|nr:RdgB/HAM1 family non-canonical purine NTP pyrophosphatase [Paludibacteraceae bacterium]